MTVTYELFYYDAHGLGTAPRTLLSLGGFNWKNRVPKDWTTEKPTTPFTHIPVLTEIQEDGSKFVLAESQAIYLYLARKMDILGKTEHETALIEQFCFSWDELHAKFWPLIGKKKESLTSEQFDESLKDMQNNEIKPVILKHEEALARNGTGFYVGDKMTLADIYAFLSFPFLNYEGRLFTKDECPNLFALHEKLKTNEILHKELHRYPLH